MSLPLIIGGKIDAEWIASVVYIVAREHPIAFKLFRFFAVVGYTQIEAMVIGVSHIVSGIGSGIGNHISLDGILSSVEGGRRAGTEDEVGGALPFLIDFVLAHNIQVMKSVESIGIPFIVVDAYNFALRA